MLGYPGVVEAVAQARVSLVETHDAKAFGHQQLDEFLGPARELHAQAHHEQHHRRVARALVVDIDHQAVGT